MTTQAHLNEFIKSLKNETDVFGDFKRIVQKTEDEGYLNSVFFTLNRIFDQEMKAIVKGSFIRNSKNENDQSRRNHEDDIEGGHEHFQGEFEGYSCGFWFAQKLNRFSRY